MIDNIPHAQRIALGEKFSLLETAHLLDLWRHQERMPWADEILHRELRRRGHAAQDLEDLKALRPKEFVYRHTVDDKWSARIGALIIPICAASAVGALTEWPIGFLAGSILFLGYALYLLAGLPRALDSVSGMPQKLYVLYDTGKFVLIAVACIYGSIHLLASRA